MNTIIKDIKKIVSQELTLLNDKVSGINLLESLKFSLMPKFTTLENEIATIKNIDDDLISDFDKNDNKIQLNCSFNKESKSYLKKEMLNDTLLVVLKGRLTVDFIKTEQSNKNKKINIFPFMGICLSSHTNVNINSFNDTFFIEFINFYSNSNFENSEKDII